MQDQLPELTKRDVEDALIELRAREKQGRRLFAFHGRYAPGHAEELKLDGGESCHVVPVRSELDLRAQMPAIGAIAPPMAFIVPWTGEIPVDLAGRFSQNGRIKRIGKESRLKRILGASELGDGILGSALAEHLLAHPNELDGTPPLGGIVTRDALFDRWLRARFGIDTSDGLALDLLLGWAAVDARGREVDVLEASHPALIKEIEEHLSRTLRDAGVVVWKAWRARRGRQLLELAVLFEALASHEQGPAYTWRGMQQAELGVTDENVARKVALQLGDAVGRALFWVKDRDPELARSVLSSAEARVTAPDVRALLVASKRLPIAWRLRLAALGDALEKGAAKPGPETLERAVEARRQLETHVFISDAKNDALIRRAGRALQLLAWLASGQTSPELSRDTPYRDAEALGRWYVEEGGFVDLARTGARGPADDPFGRGVQAVVQAADDVRRALDRRFAHSLAGWIEAGRPASQCLPIDAAVERVALRFLQGEPTRKLLVLLMDGMAWAQAVSILESLGHWAVPWGPIAWHASSQGRVGQSAYPVVFAQIPTLTEVSRAAFFAGKPTPSGTAQSTSDDPKRWLANKPVGKIEAEGIDPRLLLRGEGHTSDGVASQEALSLVGDPKRRMVAIIINAIDASLKGDTQARNDWTADRIRSFTQLLDRAREAGRAVLLAADHGHVPGDLLVSKGNITGAGARWRPWSDPADPVAEDEVAFHGNGVWAPKGAHGVVLLADDRSRYGGGAHAGEHGGASLAEVVAPCVLIAPDDGRDVVDKDQKVLPALVPSWWHLEIEPVVEGASSNEPVPPRRPSKRIKTPPKEQLALGGIAAPPLSPPPAGSSMAGTTMSSPASGGTTTPAAGTRRTSSTFRKPSPLETNELFLSRCPSADERRRVIAAVHYLTERGDAANLDAFCTALGEPTWRASGLIRSLQSALNLDGYDSITHDLKAKQVRLERAVLEAQFGIKL